MILIVLPDIPAEDELLAQARRGNERALMQIYESYFPPIYNFIRLRVEDTAMAEDLASEVFLQFVVSVRGKTAPRHSLRGWLFRVARHTLHDHYGKRQKFTTTVLEEWMPAPMNDDPEIEFIHSLDIQRARQALKMLAEEQQEVLILRFGHALDLQQTADVMGKSVSAVKSLQFRAVNTLRRILGEMRLEVSNG
jgi:RNA polymerase sigma-70 factor (ECF subfamily)